MIPSSHRSRIGCLAVLLALAPGLSVHWAAAEQGRRPSRRAAIPVPPSRAAPDVTGTVKAPAATIAPPPTQVIRRDEDEGPLKPFDLPAAPRARMRQCGESWQKIKMSGTEGDRTWREFATTCLKERPAPSSAPPRDVSASTTR